ncbi:MAG: hypothetical protein E7511_03135 [Ruminococcus sp.]|nr:hypothetical protein [Ruminococcus sp.]
MNKANLIKDSTELRKAIAENPELPIVVMVGREAVCDDYGYTYCEVVRCAVGEILDCDVPWSEEVYSDKDDFEEDLADYLCVSDKCYAQMSDEEFEKILEKKKAEYEPYWSKAIIVTADNY